MRVHSLLLLAAVAFSGCGDDDGEPDASADAAIADASDARPPDGSAPATCAADIVVLVGTGRDWQWQNRLATALRVLPMRLAAAGISAHVGVLNDASESIGTAAVCGSSVLGSGDGAFQRAGSSDPFVPDFPDGCTERIPTPSRNYFVIPDETAEATAALPCIARQGVLMTSSCSRESLEVLATSATCGATCPGNSGFYRPDSLLAVLHLSVGDDCTTRVTGALDGSPDVVLPGSSATFRSSCLAADARGQLVPVADLHSEWRATWAPGAPVLYMLVAGSFAPYTAVEIGVGIPPVVAHACFRERGEIPCDTFFVGAAPRLGAFLELMGEDGIHLNMCTLPGFVDCERAMEPDPQLDAAVNAFIDQVIARVGPSCE